MQKTKQALVMSLVSLAICVAMLAGMTYAWFTDAVTSGVNTIIAGNLDLEVEYFAGDEDEITTDGNWKSLQDATTLFDTELWEPGTTEVVYLRVKNAGTLAIDYWMEVDPISETGGINVNGDSFKLSDYLVFTMTDPADAPVVYSRDTARTDAGTTYGINQENYTKHTEKLAANGVKYVALVVYMPETVGNEANYKTGTTLPKIDLSIRVYAKQANVESDSFDENYDKDTAFDDEDITTSYNYFPQISVTGQLKISAEEVQKGDTAGDETTVTKINDTTSKVVLSSTETVDENTAAKLTTVVNKGTLEDGATGSLTLKIVKDDTANATFQTDSTKIDTDEQDSTTYQITVKCEGVTAVAESEGKALYQVDLFIGKNRTNVKMYHNGTLMTNSSSGAADTYTYDASTGYVTLYVDTFSPFTAVYDLPVCAIGTTTYDTVAAAFAAAQANDTITMISDAEFTDSIFVEKNVTLDLNGKTISASTDWNTTATNPSHRAMFFVKSGAKFTVNDSEGQNKGAIDSSTNTFLNQAVMMTILGDNDTTKTAELVVNGGTLKGYWYGICTNGSRCNTAITINDGNIVGSVNNTNGGTAIYHPSTGSLTINGGSLTGYDGLIVKGGTNVVITDGTITGTGTRIDPTTAQSSGANSTGSALYIEGNYCYGSSVNVSGGTFTTVDTTAPAVRVLFNEEPAATLTISGGTYSSDPTAYVATGYVATAENNVWTVAECASHVYGDTYTSDGAGNHTRTCTLCGYVETETCDTDGTDGACSKCGYKVKSADIIVTVGSTVTKYFISDYETEATAWNAGTAGNRNYWYYGEEVTTKTYYDDSSRDIPTFNAAYVALSHAFTTASYGLGEVNTTIQICSDLNLQGADFLQLYTSAEDAEPGDNVVPFFLPASAIPTVTLDLNGHTISFAAQNDDDGYDTLGVLNANLIIKDTSSGATGKIITALYDNICSEGNSCITLESGTILFTFDGESSALSSAGDAVGTMSPYEFTEGTVVLKGGTISYRYAKGSIGTKENPCTVQQYYGRDMGEYNDMPIGIYFNTVSDNRLADGYTYVDNGDATMTIVPIK